MHSIQIDYTEKLLLDYRYMAANSITPRYPFGFGLSYTTFGYSSLSISSTSSGYTVSFSVANTGSVAGTEKPQLYLGYPAAAGEPSKVLRGFEEVDLTIRQTKTVTLSLTTRDLRWVTFMFCLTFLLKFPTFSVWDTPSQSYIRPSGTFTVFIGASISDIRLTGTI